jgi:plastocyanin
MKRYISTLRAALQRCLAARWHSSAFAPCAQPAALWIVYVGGTQTVFDPSQLTIAPGDQVFFINKGGTHNVVADDNSFRCANGCDGDANHGSGDLSSGNWVASVTFTDPGTVGYFCEAHGQPGSGMFGTIFVQAAQPAPPPASATSATPVLGGIASGYLVLSLILAAAMRARRSHNPLSP